ncbi:MAG TPA: hypothetical protein EYP09_02025 [Anaerolineae bacterium]|nr:hypothetical protein [Anaerolineae bacterium]
MEDAYSLEDEDAGPQQDTAMGILLQNLQQGLGHHVLLLDEGEGQGFDRFVGVIPIADMYAAVSPQALYQYAMMK